MRRTGRATAHVDAPPDRVFAVITDLPNLPSWNQRMTGVIELPDELTEGAQWVVGFSIYGSRFTSRSTVLELDPANRRFAHRSKREDRNPSYTVWRWEVDPEGDGSRVTLSWELHPATFMRKYVLVPIRGRQIARQDAGASLAALARAAAVSA